MKINQVLVLSLFVVSIASAQLIAPTVTVNVSVQDEDGNFLDSVHLKAAFKGGLNDNDGEWIEADTDTNGVALLTGKSIWSIPITATKDGYYPSNVDVQTHEWNKEKKKNIYSDQSVVIVMRCIKEPIPMYCWSFSTNLYQIGEPVGFDLLVNDWVNPHGAGNVSDFVFEVSGYYTDRDNYDSMLTWLFSNKGDGFISFASNSQSLLKSPYKAPEAGYQPTKSWRKSRLPIPGERHKANVIDDSKHDANYIFRIRTVLDEKSNVVSALYGKMYGDFTFGGASKDGSYIRAGHIYVNPNSNDRNLEFDLERNLKDGLIRRHQPKHP